MDFNEMLELDHADLQRMEAIDLADVRDTLQLNLDRQPHLDFSVMFEANRVIGLCAFYLNGVLLPMEDVEK